jgi:antitoxin ParD1/3/4
MLSIINMSVSLTSYWQRFVEQCIASGRYNNQSEVIRAGLRALEEREMAGEMREFEQAFAGGQAGEPNEKIIQRAISSQKSFRKARG